MQNMCMHFGSNGKYKIRYTHAVDNNLILFRVRRFPMIFDSYAVTSENHWIFSRVIAESLFMVSYSLVRFLQAILELCCQKNVPQAGISNYIPQFTVGSNYLSLPKKPASGSKVLIYTSFFFFLLSISPQNNIYTQLLHHHFHIIISSSVTYGKSYKGFYSTH